MIECSICLTSNIISTEKCTLNCHHSFCKPCLDGWLNTEGILSYMYTTNKLF